MPDRDDDDQNQVTTPSEDGVRERATARPADEQPRARPGGDPDGHPHDHYVPL
ncbi:MAG: hypothetical protein HOV71_24345 [Hamadaea sp.]|nr:hypothetical protein [Hamadaea sp.]NUR51269.1 hypothetical protein [Hamadaea sp.]NUT02763.1 hypothetical protein [Hamadaea sp.]